MNEARALDPVTLPVETVSVPSKRRAATLLDRAYELAFFIIPDQHTAWYVALQAIDKLDLVTTAQDKRRYYRPLGRGRRALRRRNKISWPRAQLLQRLVFSEAEVQEKKHEARDGVAPHLTTEDLVVRFTKHLVRITLRRNAFYVTLGLHQLLFDYTTEETMSIYEAVVQDPACYKEDFYYRSRKRKLIAELQQRFGPLLKLDRGQRGESRFEPHPQPSRFVHLVRSCLERFTPWDSSCSLPDLPAGSRQEIPALLFAGEHPDDEHAVEIRRIHTLLHPPCLWRLTRLLGLPQSDDRLAAPYFHVMDGSRNDPGPPAGRQAPPLSERQRQAAAELLAQNARRRAKLPNVLLVSVDHQKKAHFVTDTAQRVRFDLEPEAELVEVHTADGLAIAVFMLPSFDLDTPAGERCWSFPRGQGLGLELRLVGCEQGSKIEAQLTYNPRRAGWLSWTRRLRRPPWLTVPGRWLPQMLIWLALLSAAYWTLWPPARWPSGLPSSAPTGHEAPPAGHLEGLSRGEESRSAALPLSAVRCLDIVVSGAPEVQELGDDLSRRLDRSGRLERCALEQADAVLKIQGEAGSGVFAAHLVNRAGEVLWQRLDRSLDETTAQLLVQELADDIAAVVDATKSP